jgi:hypothetical protein
MASNLRPIKSVNLLRHGRQVNTEGSQHIWLALDANYAAVGFDNSFEDITAQTTPLNGSGKATAGVALEDEGEVFRSDARTSVGGADEDGLHIQGRVFCGNDIVGKSETPALGGVLAGVAENIAEGSIKEAFIPVDKTVLVVEASFDGEVISAKLEVECFEKVTEDAYDSHGPEDKLKASGFNFAGCEKIIKEGENFDAVGMDGLNEFAGAGMKLASFTIEDQAAVSENGGEGDLDIVGDHGDHVVAEAVRVEAGKCPFHSGAQDLELEWLADVVEGVIVEGLNGTFG